MQMANGVACCIAKAAAARAESTSEAIAQCINPAQGISQAQLSDCDKG
jgi:hypothetical protein